MGALNEYRRGLGRHGVEVRLANVQPQVWMALESAGLGKLFERIDLEEPAPNGGQRSDLAAALIPPQCRPGDGCLSGGHVSNVLG
jgi:hypothetical protein